MYNFLVKRNTLLESISKVIGAVDKKQLYPVLSHCHVAVKEGFLVITGSDMEIQVRVKRELEREVFFEADEGAFTLPAKKIYDFCRALNDNHTLELKLQDQRATIKSPETTLDVSTFSPESFPFIDKTMTDEPVLTITHKQLKTALDSITYAMAIADIRYYLNGLLLQLDGEKLTLVATDGHRLACTTLECSSSQPNMRKSVIFPRRAALELARLLDTSEKNLELQLGSKSIALCMNDVEFLCKTIEGKFPDYKRVLPRDLPYTVEVDRDEMKQALLLIQPILSGKEKGILLSFSSDGLEIKAQNSENEQVTVMVKSKGDCPELKIGFNIAYLSDFINSSKSKSFSFALKDETVGVVLSHDGPGFYLVMPLRL